MPISSIHDWLHRRGDFAAGVHLLKLHGKPTSAQLFLFEQGDTVYSRRVLTEQLHVANQRADRHAVVSIDQAARKPTAALQQRAVQRSLREKPFEDIREQDLPVGLRKLRRDLMEMHRKMAWMRSRLPLLPDGPVLGDHARAIIALRKQMNAGWARIEAWRATGIELKPEPVTETVDRGALVLEQNRLRVARTRAKKKSDNDAEKQAIDARLTAIKNILDGVPAEV